MLSYSALTTAKVNYCCCHFTKKKKNKPTKQTNGERGEAVVLRVTQLTRVKLEPKKIQVVATAKVQFSLYNRTCDSPKSPT